MWLSIECILICYLFFYYILFHIRVRVGHTQTVPLLHCCSSLTRRQLFVRNCRNTRCCIVDGPSFTSAAISISQHRKRVLPLFIHYGVRSGPSVRNINDDRIRTHFLSTYMINHRHILVERGHMRPNIQQLYYN